MTTHSVNKAVGKQGKQVLTLMVKLLTGTNFIKSQLLTLIKFKKRVHLTEQSHF